MLCFSIFLGEILYFELYNQIPSVLRVKAGEEEYWDFNLPLKGEILEVSENGESNIPRGSVEIDLSEQVAFNTIESNRYLMNVKLFGLIPFKQVSIQVIGEKELVPIGEPIGLRLN